MTAKRQADIERAEVAQQLAEQGLVTENLQLRQLQNLLAVEQSRLTLNAKNKNEIQEKINKLLVQIETQKGVVAQTEANIRVTAAEAEAVRNANRIISESFEGNRQRIVDIAGEIAGLREEYRNLSGMSETVFNQRQADILTEIAKKEQEAAQAAKNMGAELVAMYAAVGVSSEEALLGMDFVAKQGIASLKKLASEGQLSAAQLAAAFENVLGKTDNEAEILTLQDALIAMGEQGEISADLLALSLAKVQVKLTEVNAAADPIQQALEQLGTGVPQKLDALANSAAAAFGVIANAKAPIDEVQQAFLKYAEAALLAAENGGKSVDPMLAQQATAIGLSAAYDELQNKLREVNPEIEAINAQFDRLAERQDLQQELTLATTEAEKAWLETQADKAEALGSESERREQLIAIAQKQAELTLEGVANDQQDLALNLERIRVIEEELATTGGLSAAQEEELAIRKASIPVIEQQISASKAKAEQAELEAEKTRIANTLISEELSRQREISAGLQTEIASLQGEYDKLVEAGVPLELLSDLLEQIRLKQEELKNSATGIDKALNDAYTSIGLNAEEVMTGMDFDTRRQIDAFDELASSGKLSADNIQRAFTNVLSKANTVDEVEAIKQKLVDLAIQGKVTGDELAQGITEVNTKLVKLRGETDATTKAMEKLGTGVPEQLNAVADEMEAAYNVLKRTQAPLDEVQQGFLKYAEAALTAAENGAKIDVAQLKTEASALGLSNAFEELQRKTKEANSELDASIAKNEREQTVLERSIALKEQQRDVEEQSIKTKKGVAEIAGNLSKISQAQAELDAKAIEDAQAKIKEMESEIAKTKELIVELEKLQKAKTITPEEAERLKLYQDEVKAKQLIIDKTKEEIPLMVKKAEASAIEAGPLGEAVRLYQAKADAMERNIVAMNEEIKQSQALQQQQVTEEQQALQLLELDKQALVVGAQTLQSEIAAAEAAGDTAKANELKLKLADNLIEQAEQEIKIAEQKVRVAKELVDMAKAEEAAAKKKAAAYQEAAEAMAKLAAATKAKAQADGDYSEEEKKAVATLEAKTAVLKGEVIAQNAAADAAKAAVEAGEKQVKIANEGVKAAKAAKEAAEANKEALKDQIANQDKDTDSKKNNTKATKDNTQAAKDRAAALEAARKAAEEAAKAEKERLEAMKKATEDAKKELQDLQIELLDTKGFDKQAAMLQEAASYSKELADLEAQRLAATEEGNLDLAKVLKDQIDVLGDIYAQKKKTYQLDLENKEGLRDARLELMGLNAEVLDEQGFAFAAEQLQQQIDYEGQLSDLRQQRLEAEKSGNIELINVLDEQKIVLGQINDLKLASIEQGYLDDIKAIQQEITDVTKEAATERLEIERDYQDELQKITDESKDAKVEAQKDVNEAYDDLIKDSLEASKEYSKSVEEELAAVAESLTEVDKDYAESVADLLEKSAETFADINEAADESLAELVTSIEERTKEAQSTLADSAESLRRELLSAQGKDGEVIAAEFGDQLQELVEQAALAGEAGKEVLNQAIADALELQNLQLDADKKSGELTDSEYSKAKEAIQERVDGLNEILATEQAIIAAKDEADKLKIEDERQAALDLAEQEKTKAQADLEDELIAKKAAIADELVDKLAALDIAHAEELANIQETYTENKASIDQALQDELASIKQARDEKLKDIAADKKEQLNTINEELKLSKEQLTVELDKAKSVMEQTTAQKALNTEMTTTLSISKEIAASFTQISAAQSSITSFLNELETAKKRSF